jgi:hypothetical protein
MELASAPTGNIYRSILDQAGTPIEVQQRLIRHSNATIAMNADGNASLRAARRDAKKHPSSSLENKVDWPDARGLRLPHKSGSRNGDAVATDRGGHIILAALTRGAISISRKT